MVYHNISNIGEHGYLACLLKYRKPAAVRHCNALVLLVRTVPAKSENLKMIPIRVTLQLSFARCSFPGPVNVSANWRVYESSE